MSDYPNTFHSEPDTIHPNPPPIRERRKLLPPVPKFEGMGGGGSGLGFPSSDEKKTFNVAGPPVNALGSSTTGNEQRIEEVKISKGKSNLFMNKKGTSKTSNWPTNATSS